jgi:tRNA uridine 5-carboxymethylaminomethyl modification enzyme
MRDLESVGVPASLDFAGINALRKEAREKLAQVRPANLGQASRIPGIGPGDLSVLRIYLASR